MKTRITNLRVSGLPDEWSSHRLVLNNYLDVLTFSEEERERGGRRPRSEDGRTSV